MNHETFCSLEMADETIICSFFLLTSLGQSSYHNEFESIVRTLDPMMDHRPENVW
jgi:hypothetical protein